MKNTRAMIQISMSWLFMIMIGTFFIILAYNIIGKYQDIEEQKNDLELKHALRNILNDVGRTAGIESSSIRSIGNIFRDSKVEVLCSDGISILSINGKLDANNEYLKNYPVFMTNIEQNKISSSFIAVESFKMPFKISNLLAIVSKKNLLVFDSQSEISEDILKKFKRGSYSELTKDSIDISIVGNKITDYNSANLNSIMFILDKSREDDFQNKLQTLKILKMPAYIILINKTSTITGSIEYIYLDSNDVETRSQIYEYIDYDETLALPTMAIFSAPSTFECSYNLLSKQVKAVYSFYIEKVKNFINSSDKLCSSNYHNWEEKDLYLLVNTSLTSIYNIDFETNRFKYSTTENLVNKIKDLELKQREIEKFSCSYIY